MQSFALSSPKAIFTPSRAFIKLFPNMNRSGERGWFSNSNTQQSFSSSSDSREPHQKQGHTSKSDTGKNKSEPYRPPQQRRAASKILENTTSRNPQEMAVVGSFGEQRRSQGGHKGEQSFGAWGRVPHQQLINLHDQEDSSMPVTLNNEPSPHRRLAPRGTVDLRNTLEAPIDGSSSKQHRPLPTFPDEVNASGTEQQISAATSSESRMGQTSFTPKDGSPPRSYGSFLDAQAVNMVRSSKRGQGRVRGHKSPERSRKGMSQPISTSPTMEHAFFCSTQPVASPSIIDQNAIKGHSSVEVSKREISPHRRSPPKRESSNHSPDNANDMPCAPFDLFLKPKTFSLKPSIFVKKREQRKDLERSLNDPRPLMLRPGMVLLKNFITHDDQIKILKKCRDTGLGPGGFYQPGYTDGAKLHLHMMCLGKNWDPQTRSYKELRSVDGVNPPIIPDEFRKLVGEAIQASHAMFRGKGDKYPDKAIPWMEPDICIVNFYTKTGKLGLHQDRDESTESKNSGLPVVSFSIGDSAEFLYGDDRDVDKAEKIVLMSGDVLIFGGKSRLIFHGVPSIVPDTAPKFLTEEVNLRPGRLNLTFRKY